MKSKSTRPLNPAQQYMLSLLVRDGVLHVVGGNRLVRTNSLGAGFTPTAQALVDRGLATFADAHDRLLPTVAGRNALPPATSPPDDEDSKLGLENAAS